MEIIEIFRELSTNGNNIFSGFKLFLKALKIFDEITYNNLRNNHKWMVPLGGIKNKYPKFCFRDIHPYNINYYWNKKIVNFDYGYELLTLFFLS